MKFISAILIPFFALSAFAMPDPRYSTLAESLAVGQYLNDNMEKIIETSAELAEKAVPNAHYFMITEKITIHPYVLGKKGIADGKSPIATLTMVGNSLSCERDVFTKIKFDDWGGKEKQSFFLEDKIRCDILK